MLKSSLFYLFSKYKGSDTGGDRRCAWTDLQDGDHGLCQQDL